MGHCSGMLTPDLTIGLSDFANSLCGIGAFFSVLSNAAIVHARSFVLSQRFARKNSKRGRKGGVSGSRLSASDGDFPTPAFAAKKDRCEFPPAWMDRISKDLSKDAIVDRIGRFFGPNRCQEIPRRRVKSRAKMGGVRHSGFPSHH